MTAGLICLSEQTAGEHPTGKVQVVTDRNRASGRIVHSRVGTRSYSSKSNLAGVAAKIV